MLASGVLCGIVGGVAMVGLATIAAAWQGIPAVHPLQVIGESFVGPEAFDSAAAKIAFGGLIHLVTSVAFGVLLAAMIPRDFPMASAIVAGVGFALFTLMFMMSLVVPWANPGFRPGMQDIGGTWVIAHAVFGVALGMTPAFRRWLSRQASDASAPDAERVRPEGPVARSM